MRNFFRKVGFGIGPDEKIPSDPLKWALDQLDEVPPFVWQGNIPTEKDYKRGFFERYFLQLASDDKASVIEVKKGKYIKADSIYHKAKMRWSLNKDIKEQERLNLKNTLEVEKTFPQIRMKIYNFVEFHQAR